MKMKKLMATILTLTRDYPKICVNLLRGVE